jgi:hypothetical protein
MRAQQDDVPRSSLGILFHGVVWCFVGALYAALFIPVFEVVLRVLPLWAAPVCATVAATVGGALVYSSHQLALLVAIFCNFAVFGQLLYSGEIGSPLAPVAVGAGMGAIVGSLYGLGVKESRIYSADAKLLASATVGLVVSLIGVVWVLLSSASLTILVAVLAPLSGMFYELTVNSFIQRYSDVLPPFADGAVAGTVVGGIIGFGLWVMGGIVLVEVAPEWRDTMAVIADSTPVAIAAASASTFVLGMLYGAVRASSESSSEH